MVQTQNAKRINDWKKYLTQQAALHPSMEPQDVYKLLFQAVFGAEHLLQDKEAAYTYFQREYEEILPKEELLYEQIHENRYRVSLKAWKKRELPAKWLFQMFVGSVDRQEKQWKYEQRCQDASHQEVLKREFLKTVEIVKEIIKEGIFAFSFEDFMKYTKEYEKTEPKAVHHSEKYREIERPAYRLVNAEYLRLLPILESLKDMQSKDIESKDIESKDIEACNMEENMNSNSKPIIIAIDGRCASGKSTMAQMLSEIIGASVIHMDDFFLPMELRTEERLSQPGGNVHYERFCEEVLPKIHRRASFSYRHFDCSRMQLGENCQVSDSLFRIVEGAYSCHPMFGDYADLKIFSEVESEEQRKRIRNRDGEKFLTRFMEKWIPMEENYFSFFHTKEKADRIV